MVALGEPDYPPRLPAATFAQRTAAHDLGSAGFGIVSGLARGIDAAAHRGSLDTGTIAVLAGGHDRVYPAEHADLLESILGSGCAVSEMPLAWEPRAEGTNGLLKQGAILVTEAADVIAVLEPILGRGLDLPVDEPEREPAAAGAEPGEDERSRIIGLLDPTPVAIDDLVRLSRTSPAIVRTVLLELEIAGRLERHGGALVSLI